MAISTKKKNIIVAMWKTGKFKSINSIAKHYKISPKTAKAIIGNTSHEHEEIIERSVELEVLKKSTKNPHDISAINRVVEERIATLTFDNELVDMNRKLLKLTQGKIAEHLIIEDLTDAEGNPLPPEKLDPHNIKSLTGAIKDIENIANPKDTSTKVGVNIVNVPTMEDLYKGRS